MSEQNGHVYEAKVWEYDKGWRAKLLRDGIAWSLDRDFPTYDEALAWCRAEASQSRYNDIAESGAKKVPV